MSGQPAKFQRVTSYADFSASNPSRQQPGVYLDAEFNDLKTTTDETIDRLALIQRDDGELANTSVGMDQLAPDAIAYLGSTGSAEVIAAITEAGSVATTAAADAQAARADLASRTLADLSAITLPADIAAITIAGATAVGDDGAGMQLVYDEVVDAGYVAANPATSFLDAAGRGFRQARRKAADIDAADGNSVQEALDARTYQIGSKQAVDAVPPVIPAAVSRIITSEQIAGSAKGGAPFIRVGADPGAGYGASEKFQDAAGNWLQMAGDLGMVTSYQFGDRGPGYDNAAAINDFLRHIARMGGNKGGLLAPWESYASSPIDLSGYDLEGVRLAGAPGKSFITCDATYRVLRLGNTDGLVVDGVGFRSDYVSDTIDQGTAVVYSAQKSHSDTVFRRCTFSAPKANTSGLVLYTALNYLDTAASVDGFLIEDCVFEDIGCQASTIMNRSNDPARMRRVWFVRPVARRCGLNGDFGFAVSFDGTGDGGGYIHGDLEDLLGIGIENTGFHNLQIIGNVGRVFGRGWCLLSINGTRSDAPTIWGPQSGVPQPIYGLTIAENRQEGDATGALGSFVSDLDASSTWRDNALFAGNAPTGLTVRRCSNIRLKNRSVVNYSAAAQSAVLCDSGSTNPVTGCNFEGIYDISAAGVSASAAIVFSGSAATKNIVTNAIIKKAATGSAVAQISGAVGNVCDPYLDGSGNRIGEYLSLNMGDADVTLSGEQAMLRYKAIRILPGNTLTRNLNFQSRLQIEQAPRIINNGTTAVQLQCAGTNGSPLAAGISATVVYDAALDSARAI